MKKILKNIRKFFGFESEKIIEDSKDKFEEVKNRANTISQFYGRKSSAFENRYEFMIGGDEDEKRKKYMTKCMDELLLDIKKEITKQPLLSRVVRNICTGALKNDFNFIGVEKRNFQKEKAVKARFYKILKESSYLDNEFMEEILYNIIKYSNSFVLPVRNDKKQLEKVLIIQNKGWEVEESIGTCYAKSFRFKDNSNAFGSSEGKKFENEKRIWHYTFNRESDEIFGLPIWVSVIPFLRKYNFLISSSIDSYSDQSLEKTIYEVGMQPNGNIRPVTPEMYNSVADQLRFRPDEDLITDVPVKATTIKKSYSSPDKTLDSLILQIIAGLYSAESQLGKSGAGRQDAETQQDGTNLIISDFQSNLERHLNKTIIKEICKDLFGDNDGENDIRLKFNRSFNDKERHEKHLVYKFQGGVIDLEETRNEMGYSEEIKKDKTFFKLYQETEMNGSVSNTNSPSNQHTSGTGTTKASKKN